jgi:hypothetical protein
MRLSLRGTGSERNLELGSADIVCRVLLARQTGVRIGHESDLDAAHKGVLHGRRGPRRLTQVANKLQPSRIIRVLVVIVNFMVLSKAFIQIHIDFIDRAGRAGYQ